MRRAMITRLEGFPMQFIDILYIHSEQLTALGMGVLLVLIAAFYLGLTLEVLRSSSVDE
jgi:hypothetical protein